MKRLARHLAQLYPRHWRARYGREFDALLEDLDVGWRDAVGVAASALEMRMKEWQGATFMNETDRPRIVDLLSRDIPNGYELETVVEFPREDGSKMLVRNFLREVDLGDSYITLSHASRGSEPAQTILVCGTKGEVSGDYRTDQTEMLVLQTDGTVRRTEQTVRTWLKYDAIRERIRERYRIGMRAGLSPDEIFRTLGAADGREP
jgi:hypothetical protein